jgi:uncharacterized protein (TIGR02118 family)
MVKLIALYTTPSEPDDFDRHFNAVHLPLLRAYPELRRLELTRIDGAPLGQARYRVMVELYFDDRASMDRALASPEGRAVTRDLMSFAAPLVTVFSGTVNAEPGAS